jgi:transposase
MVQLKRMQEASETSPGLPQAVRAIAGMYLEQIAVCSEKIATLERALRLEAARGEITARLQTMPGVGPITAMAVETFAPPMGSFRRGRDFAAWLGLVPRQKSTGGKQILGRISKMGRRDIRRLLITGAMTVVRAALRTGKIKEGWLARMLARKPRLVVAIALANKMARSIRAMLVKQEDYRDPAAAPA